MAHAYRKPVIVTHGKEYGVDDSVLLHLKKSEMIVGYITKISFGIDGSSSIDVAIKCGTINIDTDLIDD